MARIITFDSGIVTNQSTGFVKQVVPLDRLFPAGSTITVCFYTGTSVYYTVIRSYNENLVEDELYSTADLQLDYVYSFTSRDNVSQVGALVTNSGVFSKAVARYTVTATFYEVTLTTSGGSGTVTGNGEYADGETATISVAADTGYQFYRWEDGNGQLVSYDSSYSFQVTEDISLVAVFEPVYDVTTSVVGNGAIQVIRGTNQNYIDVSVIPGPNWHFDHYTIDGFVDYTPSFNLTLHSDKTIVAYFEEDPRAHINVEANILDASIYVSNNNDYPTYQSTIYARPAADYYFAKWDDEVTDNPRELTVTSNITLRAIYYRISDNQNLYSYRCFIKDQLHLTDPPKSFLKVNTFDIKTDLMTNANSTIDIIDDPPKNVNDGDILVLYDPRGTTLYQGVIKSMEGKQIICSQMQSFYKGKWIYNHHSSSTSLEAEIAYLLDQYSQGKLYGSSWTDTLVAQRLGGISILHVGTTTSKLPTDHDYSVVDMESFIYSLYEDYGIIFSFEINFSGTNYVTIKVPDYETVKVGDNMFAIRNMSPITTTEETNKLVIFSSNKTYRTTYIATTNGVVETPSTNANRFNITNTAIVFSDDAVSDIVSANLPTTMYNHKLTFDLLINNFIYTFGEFKLGGSLDVWHGEDYYNTVLTGYEIRKELNQNITDVYFICGKVRTALTKKLTMGVV